MKAGLEEEWNRRWQAVLGKNMRKEWVKEEWNRRWQVVLGKRQSQRGWGGVEHEVAGSPR